MRAGLAVQRHDRPPIRQNLRQMRALVYHRLNRENITILDLWPQPRTAIIRVLRVFVHSSPNPMADIIANDGITVGFRVLLNGPTDIAQMVSGETLLDCTLQTFFGDSNQFEPFFINLTHWNCRRSVADKTFERGATVNRENIAFL